MSKSQHDRASIALAMLEFVPPLIRNCLLDDSEFRFKYGLTKKALLSFGDPTVSIQRSKIFDAARRIFAGGTEVEVTDGNGRTWILRNEADHGQLPKLVIFFKEQRIPLPDFTVLSPKVSIRSQSLDNVAFDVNLPAHAKDDWRDILAVRALSDDEVESFHNDVRDTPIHLKGTIGRGIKAGKSTVSSLVPCSRKYFERLVGAYDGSSTIWDFASGAGRRLFDQLSSWKPYDGFLFNLFLSSHFALTAIVTVDRLEKEDIIRAYEFVEKQGDLLSKLGAIEIGLRILPIYPDIESTLIGLTRQIRDDEVNKPESGFKLLASLFVLVDGEIARSRILLKEPPFYRRLASLAQAALIHQQYISYGIAAHEVCEWAYKYRIEQFYMQSLTDLRQEPRWNPSLSSAFQMKAEFLGRILIAASEHCENIKGSPLHNLILGTEVGSIYSLIKFPYWCLPGPLEGTEVVPRELPVNLSDVIEEQLNSSSMEPSSFKALVNSAVIYGVDSDKAGLAANALKLGNYRFSNLKDKSELLTTVNGLATVAAIARNYSLADELHIVSRKYRHDPKYRLSIEEELPVCLVSAASRSDITAWRDFVGEWLTELSFSELKKEEATVFQSLLKSLCHARPELWVSCGRAAAALKALNNS